MPSGLTPTQALLLLCLKERGPMNVGALAEKLHLSVSSASAIILRMEKAGFVRRTRDTKDQRIVLVAMTEKSILLSQELDGMADRAVLPLFQGEDSGRLEKILSGLTLLDEILTKKLPAQRQIRGPAESFSEKDKFSKPPVGGN